MNKKLTVLTNVVVKICKVTETQKETCIIKENRVNYTLILEF